MKKHTATTILFRMAALLAVSAGWLAPVSAATLSVNTTNDNGSGSLRQAIADAAPGDTINFTVSGTITLTNGELVLGTNLNIEGPGASRLTVSGGGAGRVFNVTGGAVGISGLTIGSGRSTNGGGIYNAGRLSIVDCALSNNRSSGGWGGAIYNAAAVSIVGARFSGNQATGNNGVYNSGFAGGGAFPSDGFGGGIFTTAGDVTILDSDFSQNVANGGDGGTQSFFAGIPSGGKGSGGAIFVDGGTLTMARCSLAGNSATGGRGGSAFTQSGSFGGSGGNGSGGGLFIRSGTVTIFNSTLSSNAAGGGGASSGFNFQGPIYSGGFGGSAQGGGIWSGGELDLMNCTLADNSVTGGSAGSGGGAGACPSGGDGVGGGISSTGTVRLTHCTIDGNVAVGGPGASCFVQFPPPGYFTSGSAGIAQGGGFYQPQGAIAATILNTIIAGNRTNSEPGDMAGNVTSEGYNLIGVTNNSRGWISSDLFGNSDAPLDPKVGPLQNNGGRTWTMGLQAGSPAIDAGFNAGHATDQRGRPRPIDDPAIPDSPGGDGSDIGAFELQSQPITLFGPVKSGSNLVVSLLTEIGQTYRIEQKDVLTPGLWTTVSNNLAGTGALVPVTDPGAASQPLRFYRGQTLP